MPPSPTGNSAAASSDCDASSPAPPTTTGHDKAAMTTYTVINPATEQPVRRVELNSAEQADAAIERAARAQEPWRAVSPGDRARLLRRFAEQGDAHVGEPAPLATTGPRPPIRPAPRRAGQV